MKKIVPTLLLAGLSMGAAHASLITVTLEGVADLSGHGPVGSSYLFMGSFDSSELVGRPEGGFGVNGTVRVLVDAGVIGDCTVLDGSCANHLDIHRSESGPDWASSFDEVNTGTIGLYRNADGSFDLSRTHLSLGQSQSQCSFGSSFGGYCSGTDSLVETDGLTFTRRDVVYGRSGGDLVMSSGAITRWSISPVPQPGVAVTMALGIVMLAGIKARKDRIG